MLKGGGGGRCPNKKGGDLTKNLKINNHGGLLFGTGEYLLSTSVTASC